MIIKCQDKEKDSFSLSLTPQPSGFIPYHYYYIIVTCRCVRENMDCLGYVSWLEIQLIPRETLTAIYMQYLHKTCTKSEKVTFRCLTTTLYRQVAMCLSMLSPTPRGPHTQGYSYPTPEDLSRSLLKKLNLL